MNNGKPQTTETIEDFVFIASAPIHSGNWMRLGAGRIKIKPGLNTTIAEKN